VLLLDEPSASLDPRQRERLWEFIGGLAERGTTVVFSTHDVGEAERYAGRVLELAAEVGPDVRDFETAFVRFLHAKGH
jgi:ABC-2 type transport system ATP-binding protein